MFARKDPKFLVECYFDFKKWPKEQQGGYNKCGTFSFRILMEQPSIYNIENERVHFAVTGKAFLISLSSEDAYCVLAARQRRRRKSAECFRKIDVRIVHMRNMCVRLYYLYI